MRRQPRCLMLDVDGVVVTGRSSDGAHWSTGLEQDLGVSLTRLQEMFFRPHWSDIVLGTQDLRSVLHRCWPDLRCDVSVDEFLTYWFETDARLDHQLLADVAELCEAGLTVCFATNQEHLRAQFLWNDLGLKDHGAMMLYSADLGVKKPDADFYAACEKRCGFSKSQVVFIDDTPANVESANAAGWNAAIWTGEDRLSDLVDRLCAG